MDFGRETTLVTLNTGDDIRIKVTDTINNTITFYFEESSRIDVVAL